MPTVFKYCDAYGVDILTNLELKATPPNLFNDPFEFTPHIICSDPIYYATSQLNQKEQIRTIYQNAVLCGRYKETFREFRKDFKEKRALAVRTVASKAPAAMEGVQAQILDEMSKKNAVLCLSRLDTSVLMWGHYCRSHKGIVVGLDDTNDVFKQGMPLRDVTYQNTRIVFDVTWAQSSPDKKGVSERIIFTKNGAWNYENEVRQVFALRTLRQKPIANGSNGYFVQIPPKAIVKVILGARIEADLETKVRHALADPLLSHVRIQRASLHLSEFRLNLTDEPLLTEKN